MTGTQQQRPFRVGVIGAGFGAVAHIPAYQRLDDFEVVAVVSGRAENARRAAEKAGVGWSGDDYRRMLAEVDLDVVSVAAPGYLHHDMVIAAAGAGKHIVCEKPMTTSVSQGREMLDAVRQAGVHAIMNFEFRLSPNRLRAKQLVDQGVLGRPYDARATQDMGMVLAPDRRWSWWANREQYGGIMQARTSHVIDFLLWTMGPIASVSAFADTVVRSLPDEQGRPREVTSDDNDVALLRFANGAAGLLHVSAVSRWARNEVDLHGTEGSLLLPGEKLEVATGAGKPEPVDLEGGAGMGDLVAGTFQRFAGVLRGAHDPVLAPLEQGLRVQAVMDALHASADQGGQQVPVAGD